MKAIKFIFLCLSFLFSCVDSKKNVNTDAFEERNNPDSLVENVMSIDEIGFEIDDSIVDLDGYYIHGVGFVSDDGDTIRLLED